MNALLKFLLSIIAPFYAVDPAGGESDASNQIPDAPSDAGSEVTPPAGPAADTAPVADVKPAEPKPVSVDDMAEAIASGLSKDLADRPRGPDGKFLPKAEADTKTPEQIAADAGKTDAQLAADNERKAAEKAAADAKALEGKTAESFKLSPEQEKLVKAETKERFQGLISYAKSKEAEIAELRPQMQALQQARDGIMSIMQESHTEPEELGRMLDWNSLIKTGQIPKAIEVLEQQRALLYRALGKEAPGVDLVSEFPDLNARVAAQELSRDDALELANARRRDAALTAQGQRQQTGSQEQAENFKQRALVDIDAWSKKMALTDVNFAAREPIVAQQIANIINTYPPQFWLTTIEALYRVTPVPAPKPLNIPRNETPLRPTGTKPGPAAPNDMFAAISQGTGYTFTQ